MSADSSGVSSTKCDVVVRAEVTIDRCAHDVWLPFLEMESWMTGLRFENVSGERGAEGEVRLVTPTPDSLYRSYYTRAVRVTPRQQYVVKVTPAEGAGYLAFADFSFTERDGKTHLVYDIYLELSLPAASEGELNQLRFQQHRDVLEEVTRNNRNLKSLVESRPRSAHGKQ